MKDVYPDIADTVLGSIKVPVVPKEIREEYARPDVVRLYIPPDDQEDSDEESKREKERNKLASKYKYKRIDRITKKFKNATGQVRYNVLWTDSSVEEPVSSKALQDHKDWDLVEHYEYQLAIRMMIRGGMK